MSSTKWTKEQLHSIEKKGSNILVAAAAGSGKTTVLVERIIQKIINEKIDIDSILVVTFTNAAASEMKEKILNAIYKKIDENPDDEHLKRQMNLINKSNICTIHSFCLDLIKNNFFEIDISHNFRIGDTSEIELLKIDTLDELFEEKYNENDEELAKLLEIYGDYKGDEQLKEIIFLIYKFIQSFPFPFKWLSEKIEEFNLELDNDFSNTIWGKIIIKDLKQTIDKKIYELNGVLKVSNNMYDIPNSINSIKNNIKDLESLKNNIINWEDINKNIREFNFTTWKGDKNDNTKIIQERRTSVLNNFKKSLISKYAINSNDANSDIKYCYPILKSIEKIIIEFDKKFLLKKKEKNIIDFNDIEHFALKILIEEDEDGNQVSTEVAKKYQKKFNEIAIDEYQDSNLIQEYILTTISKNNNIFMVGDVKQSIYKFRQARPELFLEKYNTYSYIDENDNKNKKIQLFKNFRSRENVLNITNIIFKEIMSKELGDIDYTEEEFLNLGANYIKPEEEINYAGNIELHLIDLKDEEKSEWDLYEENFIDENQEPVEKNLLEAKLVANRIKEITNGDYNVYDNGKYRKATYKDIVILLRKTKDIATIYEDELTKLNIPVYSDTSTEYLDSVEIQTIMSLLKIIDNPLQDIPLVAVMRSMIGNFTDNELVEIRLIDKYCNFYEAVQKSKIQVNDYLKEKIEKFISNINKWREQQEYLGLDELIWNIYEETGYYDYVGLMPNGVLRQANLKLLFEKAKEYENASFTGLFNFIKFIDKLKLSNGDMSSAKIIGENENVVRIMSIHKSKGLEFPVVFLSNSSKQFNMQDLSNNIILDQDLGIGPKYINYKKQVQYNTLAKEAIKIKAKKENISEEMRILYVALTRAKEKLIITGTTKNLNKEMEDKLLVIDKNEDKINENIISKYNSYLDWIELVYLKNKEMMEKYFSVYNYKKKDLLKENNVKEEVFDIKNLLDEINKHKNVTDSIKEKLNWKYENMDLSKIESKMSVSDIKRNMNNKEDEITLEKPKFISETDEVSASKKGTLIHLCMQRLNVNKEYNIEELKLLVNELVSKKIIFENEAKSINLKKILNFTKSKTWKELKNAKVIEREKPFYINIPADYIYGNNIKDKILVQGIIDLYYINNNDELILLDYKTDFVENRDENYLIEKYKIQLELYKEALEKSLNKKVNKTYIYSTYLDKEIQVELKK